MMQRLSGKEVRQALLPSLRGEVEQLRRQGVHPTLGMILVGEHAESQTYVAAKARFAAELGLRSLRCNLPQETSQQELAAQVARWNADPLVHGVLCQMPLPAHLDANAIMAGIAPQKDVDCFHPHNFGLLAQGRPRFIPCTPAGVLRILQHYGIRTQGRRTAVVGRSTIAGRPLSLLLSSPGWDATVVLCHSRSPDLAELTRQAELVVVAIGRPGAIGAAHLQPGAVVIDVGLSRVADASRPKGYRLRGDVDFAAARQVASAITPVPGGVGLMTVAMLMQNTLQAARLQQGGSKETTRDE